MLHRQRYNREHRQATLRVRELSEPFFLGESSTFISNLVNAETKHTTIDDCRRETMINTGRVQRPTERW